MRLFFISSMLLIFDLIANCHSNSGKDITHKQTNPNNPAELKGNEKKHHRRNGFLKFIKACNPINFCGVFHNPPIEPTEFSDEPIFKKHEEFEVDEIGAEKMKNWTGKMGNKNADIKCGCGRKLLGEMLPVKFFEELEGHEIRMEENFLVENEPMGQGGYAKVYHAIKISDDWNFDELAKNLSKQENESAKNCIAIKVANPQRTDEEAEAIEILEKEKSVLEGIWNQQPQKTSPKHLIGLRAIRSYKISGENKKKMAILLEKGQDNLKKIWGKTMDNLGAFSAQPSQKLLMGIARQILTGINEFHEQGRILMDLKPENIIAMPPKKPFSKFIHLNFLHLKLIDFADSIKVQGSMANRPQKQQNPTISWEYLAPEIYLAVPVRMHEYDISQKTDIWMFGLVCLELLLMTPKFARRLANKEFAKEALGEDWSESSTHFWDHEIRRKMVEWVFMGRRESKSGAVEILDKKLKKKYPKMRKMLEDCFKFDQRTRLNAGELLRKHFSIEMGKIDENVQISGSPSNAENELRKFHRILTDRTKSSSEILQETLLTKRPFRHQSLAELFLWDAVSKRRKL